MRLFLIVFIALSTLAAARPLPFPSSNTLEARAPTSSSHEGRLIEPVKPRSVHDSSHADNNEKLAAVLPKRGFWGDLWFGVQCASTVTFKDQCSCPDTECDPPNDSDM